MHRALLLLLVVLFAGPVFGTIPGEPKEAPAKQVPQKLQGTWQVTKFIDHSEQPAPADEIKEFTFEFKEDRLTMRKRKGDDGRTQLYTIDSSKNPKWIDIGVTKGSPLGEAIYKLEGDVLTICVVGSTNSDNPTPRPSEFKAKKKQHTLFELKRVNK